jgi:hypothetical protein
LSFSTDSGLFVKAVAVVVVVVEEARSGSGCGAAGDEGDDCHSESLTLLSIKRTWNKARRRKQVNN